MPRTGQVHCFDNKDFKCFLGLNGFTTENRNLSAYKYTSLPDTNFGDTLFPLGLDHDGKYISDRYLQLGWIGPGGRPPLGRAPDEDDPTLKNHVISASFVTLDALIDHQKSQKEWQAYDDLLRLKSPDEFQKIEKEELDGLDKASQWEQELADFANDVTHRIGLAISLFPEPLKQELETDRYIQKHKDNKH